MIDTPSPLLRRGFWVHQGSVTEDREWEILEALLPEILPQKKRTILLDNGYHPDKLMEELKKIDPAIDTKIEFELSPKISKAQKKQLGKTGFVPVKARWVIERSNAWMDRCKSLLKNCQRTLENATTKVNLCFVRLMLKRLAAG